VIHNKPEHFTFLRYYLGVQERAGADDKFFTELLYSVLPEVKNKTLFTFFTPDIYFAYTFNYAGALDKIFYYENQKCESDKCELQGENFQISKIFGKKIHEYYFGNKSKNN